MGGGLMQLVAYGAQDVYLSGNPQITFFKVVYRRHTNFSVEPIQQTWNGVGDFGRTVTCNINRNGDLITNMYLVVELAAKTTSTSWGYVNRLGNALIQMCKVEIGGSMIDTQYGDWLNVWYELTHKVGQERGFARMIGDVPELKAINSNDKPYYVMYVPLQFWFNRNNGLALPLIALQYHDVRITVQMQQAVNCVNYLGATAPSNTELPSMADCYLLIDYVYLDSEERKRFAQASHEYLIEQLQFTGPELLTSNSKLRLTFNHPSKYLVWCPHLQNYRSAHQWLSFASDDNWGAAKDNYAKLLCVSTADEVELVQDSTNSYNKQITVSSTATTGDVITLPSTADFADPVRGQLQKVDVKFVVSSTLSGNRVVIADVSRLATDNYTPTNADLLADLLANAVVHHNSLSMADISMPVSSLTGLNAGIVGLAQVTVVMPFNYGNNIDGSDNPIYNAKIQLNGHDRFQDRDGAYFNYVQPWQHFSNTPADGINVYSFALKAEDHQPTGTCNFSRIDNATLLLQAGQSNQTGSNAWTRDVLGNASNVNVYTVNYNVLRVMSGMAGTAYSN